MTNFIVDIFLIIIFLIVVLSSISYKIKKSKKNTITFKKDYKKFVNFKGRYRIVKGSKASKKSKTTASWIIQNMMNSKYSLANTLVIQKTEQALKDSSFQELQWVLHQLNVEKNWKYIKNPFEMIYIPTGQKIIFRNINNASRSISLKKGYLCWVWVEDAHEITLDDFLKIDESLRGTLPKPLFYQLTLTFTPWKSSLWIKKKFFDQKSPEILAITTTYKTNEWLDIQYLQMLENLRKTNPNRYQVIALGEWELIGNQIYENYEKKFFDPQKVPGILVFGLDFGYSKDPTAFFVGKINIDQKILYVINEIYEKKLLNNQIAELITQLGYQNQKIYADCSAPKDIEELSKKYGIKGLTPCRKGKNSILNGIGFIQNYKIIIHPICKNFYFEIENYVYKKNKVTNEPINEPEDKNNHLMDAMRYALEPFIMEREY